MKTRLLFIAIAYTLIACDQSTAQQTQPKKTQVKIKYDKNYTIDVIPKGMTVAEKKERFRQLLVPATKQVYLELEKQYEHVKNVVESGLDEDLIAKLKVEYRAKSKTDLLERLKPHPVSIVLAQAAMESSWATSRFSKEANNIFGVWSFDENEPRIAALEKRGNKTIWLKKYNSIEDSIRDNYRVLARGSAYAEFRKLRLKTDDPFRLVKALDQYSEIGDKYGEELAAVIRFNKFVQYDL